MEDSSGSSSTAVRTSLKTILAWSLSPAAEYTSAPSSSNRPSMASPEPISDFEFFRATHTS